MNTGDVLKYGHRTVLRSVAGLPEEDWYTAGVTGVWSVKEVIAHLASHELVFVDILNSFLNDRPTPTLDKFRGGPAQFNDDEVALRKDKSAAETLAEYSDAHSKTLELIEQIPFEIRRQNGTLPWYGEEYDLEDYVTYGVYGHKREHSAQIGVFRDKVKR